MILQVTCSWKGSKTYERRFTNDVVNGMMFSLAMDERHHQLFTNCWSRLGCKWWRILLLLSIWWKNDKARFYLRIHSVVNAVFWQSQSQIIRWHRRLNFSNLSLFEPLIATNTGEQCSNTLRMKALWSAVTNDRGKSNVSFLRTKIRWHALRQSISTRTFHQGCVELALNKAPQEHISSAELLKKQFEANPYEQRRGTEQ